MNRRRSDRCGDAKRAGTHTGGRGVSSCIGQEKRGAIALPVPGFRARRMGVFRPERYFRSRSRSESSSMCLDRSCVVRRLVFVNGQKKWLQDVCEREMGNGTRRGSGVMLCKQLINARDGFQRQLIVKDGREWDRDHAGGRGMKPAGREGEREGRRFLAGREGRDEANFYTNRAVKSKRRREEDSDNW